MCSYIYVWKASKVHKDFNYFYHPCKFFQVILWLTNIILADVSKNIKAVNSEIDIQVIVMFSVISVACWVKHNKIKLKFWNAVSNYFYALWNNNKV